MKLPVELCERVGKVVEWYYEDELSPKEAIAAGRHVAKCLKEGRLLDVDFFEVYDALGLWPEKDNALEAMYLLYTGLHELEQIASE